MLIILSLGSNNNAEQNMQMAEERLQRLFPAIRFSKTLMNEPYGNHLLSSIHHSSLFANAIGVGETTLPLSALISAMKALETHLGRTAERKQQGIIDIDIDILQYGDTKLKLNDWQRPYNIELLKEFNLNRLID